jgi:hypothetical protein
MFFQLGENYRAFEEAFNAALAVPTHANILRRQEAQTATTAILREFVNQFLRFPPVTNVDRAEMGINNHDTIRTDHTVVTENMDFVIRLNEPCQYWRHQHHCCLDQRNQPQEQSGH